MAEGGDAATATCKGAQPGAYLTEADLEGLLSALYMRKQALQQRSAQDSLQLLLHFLHYSRCQPPRPAHAHAAVCACSPGAFWHSACPLHTSSIAYLSVA